MTDDLVTRLRCNPCDCDGTCLTCQAADEIEWLRIAGDKLAQGVLDEHQPFPNDKHIVLWWLVVNWQEARRG